MKKTIGIILFLFATVSLHAQQIIKSDQVADFHAVSVSGNINVELIPAAENSVDIQLYDSDIKKFKWSVSNGTLSLSLRPTSGAKARADVRVYYKGALQNISVVDARVTAMDLISHTLRISVAGGANFTADLDAQDLELEVTGNSVALVSGMAKYATLRATERSRVDTRKMDAVSVEAEAATTAELYVTANERLVANAKSGATIFYAGSPSIFKDRSTKVSSSIGSSVLNIGYKE
ncbi:DUF2807 domain-containing protein [Alistipes sp. OttesenSCG-928-B03]|nr:DUF2807 domain-containing protein [Alistipes sp. OttesenSCG-928-B03]